MIAAVYCVRMLAKSSMAFYTLHAGRALWRDLSERYSLSAKYVFEQFWKVVCPEDLFAKTRIADLVVEGLGLDEVLTRDLLADFKAGGYGDFFITTERMVRTNHKDLAG